MPQDMNVLRCYSCKMYQVHIVKKARKWQCKLCNAKQSIQKVYFQGSGKDCRLHVQHLNYLKTNDISFSLYQENSNDDCNTTNTVQELDIDKSVESEWTKYLDSPKEECLSNAQNSSSDSIHEIKDMITNEKCNAMNNDLCDSEDIVDDFVSKNIADKTEKICSTSSNCRIEDKCNLQNRGKSNKDHNDIANIFETYSELDDPIDI
ncbi:MRNIP protein, partial [Acromyrmex heyeri]